MQRTRAHGHPATSLRRGEREGERERNRYQGREREKQSTVHNDPRKLVNSQGRSVALPWHTHKRTREGRTVRSRSFSLYPRNIVFVSYRDFTAMPRCHHPVTQHPVYAFQTSVHPLSVFLSAVLVRLYQTEGRGGGRVARARTCANAAARRLLLRFTGTRVKRDVHLCV